MVGRLLGFVVLVALLALVVIVVLRLRDLVVDRAAQVMSGGDRRQHHALEEARQRLRRAEKRQAKRVHRARKQLVEAGRDPVLAKVGPVILGPCTVTVKKVVHELGPSTVFRVDVEGEVRQVVTRRGGQEKVERDDQREVYLTITDEAWADVVKLSPTQLEGARRVEAAGAAAVRNLEKARDERDARVLEAQAQLEQVMADTAEVDGARMTLEDLEGAGPRRIDVPEPPPVELDGGDPDERPAESPYGPDDPDGPDGPDGPDDPDGLDEDRPGDELPGAPR